MSYRSLPPLPRKVAKLEDVPDWAVRCHAWLHPWREPVCRRFSYWGFDSILAIYRCTSCHSLRRDVRPYVNPGSKLTTRLYRYPHDYQVAFPMTVADWRDEWFRRFDAPPEDIEGDDWSRLTLAA